MVNQESVIARCTQCGAKNRIPGSRVRERPVCGRCKHPLSTTTLYPDHAIDITDRSFEHEVPGFPGSVAVYIWSPRCGHCSRMTPVVNQLVSKYVGQIKFTKLVMDQNPQTPSRFGIQGVPAFLLYKGGRQIDKVVGAIPQEELERRLRAIL